MTIKLPRKMDRKTTRQTDSVSFLYLGCVPIGMKLYMNSSCIIFLPCQFVCPIVSLWSPVLLPPLSSPPSLPLPGLLELADLYCEFNLKEQCSRLLCRQINDENAVSLYLLALQYKLEVSVKCMVIQYIQCTH